MNANNHFATHIHHKTIVPVILRITFSLLLWTLGFASMNLVEAQVKPQRVVRDYPVDRIKLEHLQRWVNEGHDSLVPRSQARCIRRSQPRCSRFRQLRIRTGFSPHRTDNRPRHKVDLHFRVTRWPHHVPSNPAPLSLAASHRRRPRPDRLGAGPHRDHHPPHHRLTFGVRWLATAFTDANLATKSVIRKKVVSRRTLSSRTKRGICFSQGVKHDFHHANKTQCSLTSRAAPTTLPGNFFREQC